MKRHRKTISAIGVVIGLAVCYPPEADAQLWLSFAHPDEPHQIGSFLPALVFGELFTDFDMTIEVPMVVVLMEFPDNDHDPQYTTADFAEIFFGIGSGSVAEYYAQTSNGRINVVPAMENHGSVNDGVIGWLDADGNSGDFTIQEKRAEAVRLADDYIDFTQYDADSNNLITNHEFILALVNPGSGGGQTWDTDPEQIVVDGGDMTVQIAIGALGENQLAPTHSHETGHPFIGGGDLYAKCDPNAALNWAIGDGYICNIASDSCGAPGEGGDNEDCDCPRALNPVPNVIIGGSNSGTPPGVGGACGDATATNGATAWYEVYGNGNTLTASTCVGGTNFDTQISVFCNGCDELKCVSGNDDAGGCGTASQVSWCTEQDVSYLIAVHGGGGDEGSFQLAISDSGVACNDAVECGLAAGHSRHWYPYTPQFMSIMASGNNGQEGLVVPLDPWGKIHLGFTRPKVITHDGTYTVHAVEPLRSFDEQDNEPEAYIVYNPQPLATQGFSQYFIIEARNDPAFDDQGLAIWLINEKLTTPLACSNNGWLCTTDDDCGSGTCSLVPNLRRMMRLVHRDGHNPGTAAFLWDSDDAFYYDFTAESTPRNSAWSDGTPSFVEIYDVSGAGDSMTFKVRIPPIHVDFSNNSGTETGSAEFPFKFLTGGVNTILEPPRSIRIAGGNYPEILTITTPCTIAHWKGGSAVVGD